MISLASDSTIIDIAAKSVSEASAGTIAVVTATAVLGVTYAASKFMKDKNENIPPHIPSSIPFLGKAISFNQDSSKFLLAAYEKYGPVFSFTMVGKTFTYLVGSEASALFFNSKNDQLNAEKVYGKLTTPVFGPGVAYDVPNHIFLEQKKMFKTGLNISRFRQHIPMIQEETELYFQRWGDSGEKDIFAGMSEVIILTASRCLHGKEIRSQLNEQVAELYWDLDGGFSHLAWLLPPWVPLPSFRKRDAAHIKIKKMFYEAIDKRRLANENGEREDDMLQTLIDSKYKSGRNLTDDEIAGMCIGLLLAGQHTSSTTISWIMFYLAANKDIQNQCYDELMNVYGNDEELDYDGLKRLDLLERCMKESLRIRPPLFTVMRLAESPQKCMGYTIPAGHQICVSPPVNQMLPSVWPDSDEFKPDRFLDQSISQSDEKFNYVPFGAGRHRCIGESFAFVQIKTLISVILRKYEFSLINGRFPPIDKSTMIQIPEKPIIAYKLRKD